MFRVALFFALVWCKNNTSKGPKYMSSVRVLSFVLSVSQTHMYKYRHSSLDPPLTHLRQLFLRTLFLLNKPQRADQPVHMTSAPLLLSGVPLTLTEVHCTAPMLCLKQTAIHYVSETFPIVHLIVSFIGGLSKYSL